MTCSTPDWFFDFPGEIREQILSHLVVKPAGVHIGEAGHGRMQRVGWGDADEDMDVCWPLNYFLVSNTFYAETSALFFGQNTFYLHAHAGKAPVLLDGSHREGLLANKEYRNCRRRMRRVVLFIRRLGGQLETEVAPPLLDMMLAGGLKTLDIRFSLPGRGHRSERVWTTGPAKALFRLLSDPDLEAARLRVKADGHEAIWCPFHEGGRDGWEQAWAGCEETPGGLMKVRGRRAAGWVDVDVGGLLRRHGAVCDQLRIVKVGG